MMQRISSLWLGTLKATIALTLTLILIFIKPWTALCSHPTALNGTLLVVVGARPGRTVGGCTQDVLLGGAGLASGVICFVVLAELRDAPVAQGFVFAFYVYLAALVRAGGAKYISFYLYGVLFAFNGIYMPIEAPNGFDYSWLLACFEAYAWGMAIGWGVNLLVYPVSAEDELKRLLVGSLHHVSTLAHLTCKTYAKEIDEDEEEVRQLLVRTIRSDYLSLTARLDEMSFEIIWSRFTFTDWHNMIARVQGLQQALITSSSALELIDTLDPEGVNVKRHLLARAEASRTFGSFRRGIDLVIGSIVNKVLGDTVLHREADHSSPTTLPPNPEALGGKAQRMQSKETFTKIDDIGKRLQREVQRSEVRQANSRKGSLTDLRRSSSRTGRPSGDAFGAEASAPVDEDTLERDLEMRGRGMDDLDAVEKGEKRKAEEKRPSSAKDDPVEYFRESWTAFAKAQADALIRLIRDGSLQVEDKLRIESGMPSLQAMYAERLPKAWTSSLIATTSLNHRPSPAPRANTSDSRRTVVDDEDVPCSEALTKSYSLLFGFGQLTDELCGLHSIVKHHRAKRIRPYIFQTAWNVLRSWRWWAPKDGMHLQEALALLRGEQYCPPKVSLFHRIFQLEKWFRSDRSMYALKVALGATIYTVFLLAPTLQDNLFIKYGMTSSLITVIVAIAPTMGATFSTWVLQLTGTGCGATYGLIVLEIFKGVGSYSFNPYGCAAFFFLWCAFSSYFFYKYPKYYTGTLLLVTGCGSMLVLEWLYNENAEVKADHPRAYDTPPMRFAYTLASMCISIVISAVFQLFILRTPARRKLRLQIAAVTFALSSYNTLLQSNINLVAPADASPAPPQEALAKVQRELIKRESRIQASILALGPTFEFAKAEPALATPFKGDVLLRIIRSHQIILDRLREARTAVGTDGFNETVHRDFASALFPYRLHSQRLARTLFYLGATSLVSKTQLARDVPSSKPTWASFENDALVLSRRLSQLPRGERELKRPGFLRYWFFLISLGAVSSELESLEEHLGELFGSPEQSNPQIV